MAGRIYKSILVFTLAFSALLMAQTPPDNSLAPYIPKNMKPYYLDILVTQDSADCCEDGVVSAGWLPGLRFSVTARRANLREHTSRASLWRAP
jgi:hypothetical protein